MFSVVRNCTTCFWVAMS